MMTYHHCKVAIVGRCPQLPLGAWWNADRQSAVMDQEQTDKTCLQPYMNICLRANMHHATQVHSLYKECSGDQII